MNQHFHIMSFRRVPEPRPNTTFICDNRFHPHAPSQKTSPPKSPQTLNSEHRSLRKTFTPIKSFPHRPPQKTLPTQGIETAQHAAPKPICLNNFRRFTNHRCLCKALSYIPYEPF